MRNWTNRIRPAEASALLLAGLGVAACSTGEFKEPMKLGGQTVSAATLEHGKEQYTQYCRPCHGENGDGKGPSSPGLRPPPRDFTQGLFKFGGVQAPALPPDEELKRIVTGGLHGTAMLPWDIPDAELGDVLQYIKTFSPRWKEEAPGKPIEIGADPFGGASKGSDKWKAAVDTGKRTYHAKAQCSGCHPAYVTHQELFDITKAMSGAGVTAFGPDMYHSQPKESEYCLEWKAGWKKIDDRECARTVRVIPPDFTRDPLRNVRLAKDAQYDRVVDDKTTMTDLYRTIAAGIGGANMPTWKGQLSEEQLWGMVYFVKSLLDLSPVEVTQLHKRLDDPANLSWTPPAAPPAPAPPSTNQPK